ncbi:MAG: sigma 54-interacting transcriptional regulator [Methylotenera sp.]|nr:sigma 54-interacting transcriptional regulator [Methylotenera sp.]MDD4926849.1 sigma 54-interacting transcriptional regulator [Methylotenera sp.]
MIDNKQKILVVNSDVDKLILLCKLLQTTGYQAKPTKSGQEALAQISIERPALVITELRLSDMDGLNLFDTIHQTDSALPMIILTAHGSISQAVTATQRGVFDFIEEPADEATLLNKIKAAIGTSVHSSTSKSKENAWREGIFTRSPQMENLISQARLVAASDASVLIQGESGTGKELLAHAIHQVSPRKAGPFVAINCGAMPESLLESELFGHSKGAFTGAVSDHKGLFQSAEGGTILLDEIGDMPLLLQVKLLRVLQERVVRPVGSNTNIPINVRVISATHRDLVEEMKAKRFREDLYYRINVVGLSIPTLAERREDIALIANNLLQALCKRYDKKLNGFAPEAMQLLIAAPWPGNVRQLQNIVEQTVVLATTPIVSASLVQKALQDNVGTIMPFEASRKNFERNYLINLLKTTSGNIAQAASLAQRHRTEFYKLLERHELTPAMFKESKPIE